MPSEELLKLQDMFECQKCGKCCLIGSGVPLTKEESYRLNVPCSWTSPHPCLFLDMATMQCTIHDDKPHACRICPFGSVYEGLSSFDTLLICPGALKALADYFEVKQEH